MTNCNSISRIGYRGQKCDGSNLGQRLRRDTPPAGISPMVYIRTVVNPSRLHAEIVHVCACACVRVRAIPAQVHVLLTISNCTEGRARKKTFSLCPSPLFPPLPLRERSSSLERRKEKRIRSFFPFLFPQAMDEIRDKGEIGAVKGGVIWKSNYEKERRIIEIIAGN